MCFTANKPEKKYINYFITWQRGRKDIHTYVQDSKEKKLFQNICKVFSALYILTFILFK